MSIPMDPEYDKLVKRRDRYAITVTASQDLTGSTVRLLHRRRGSTADGTALAVVNATPTGSAVSHLLDGTLGDPTRKYVDYELELEATWPTTPPTIATFPTDQEGNPQVLILRVQSDIA